VDFAWSIVPETEDGLQNTINRGAEDMLQDWDIVDNEEYMY
jgi:hypothetical protein